MHGSRWFLLAAALAGALVGAPAAQAEFRLRTEIGATDTTTGADSLAADLGYRDASALTAAARAMWTGAKGSVSWGLHLNLTGASGTAVGLVNAAAQPLPPATMFDLTNDLVDDTEARLTATLDRAFLSFTSDKVVLTFGRQAITWGAGYFFRPMDIVAPFPPDAIDTSYKPGVDMVYGQYLFASGADIQAIWVPRPATAGGPVDPDASTLAAYSSSSLGPLSAHVLIARDHGARVGGLGLAGPLGGAAWNLEWVGMEAGSVTAPFWLANISDFTTLGTRNVNYYAEYYHNGLGVASSVPLDALPAELAARMSYGQVFLPGPDFLGLGGQVEVSPTTTVTPSAIVSLGDGSALLTLAVDWSLTGNADLYLDLSGPVGGRGTEFGGRETSAGSGVYAATPRKAVLRYVRFF